MLRLMMILVVFASPQVRAGERHPQAELVLDTVAIWSQSTLEDMQINAVKQAIKRTGEQHGFIAYLSLEMKDGGNWGCYQKAEGQALCQNAKESLKRVSDADHPVWFEWSDEGKTYLEYAFPVYFSDYDGTQLLAGAWRLGVAVER